MLDFTDNNGLILSKPMTNRANRRMSADPFQTKHIGHMESKDPAHTTSSSSSSSTSTSTSSTTALPSSFMDGAFASIKRLPDAPECDTLTLLCLNVMCDNLESLDGLQQYL
jgi:hypothetical protein